MPREPDEVAVMMQGFAGSNASGICTSSTTFCWPVPSSEYAMYSTPGTMPLPEVALPFTSTLGPYSVP